MNDLSDDPANFALTRVLSQVIEEFAKHETSGLSGWRTLVDGTGQVEPLVSPLLTGSPQQWSGVSVAGSAERVALAMAPGRGALFLPKDLRACTGATEAEVAVRKP